MKRRTLFAGLLALTLTGSIMSAAFAATFARTITLDQGAGQFTIDKLGIDDNVVLTLVNPSNTPLTFSTTQNIGNEKSWTVAPKSERTVSFHYTRPFDDDVEFMVTGPSGGEPIARGTLIRKGVSETPASYQQGPTVQQQQGGPVVAPANNNMNNNVRGYW